MARAHGFLLHLNWCWIACAPVESGVTLDSTGCCVGRARGGVREVNKVFGDLNFGIVIPGSRYVIPDAIRRSPSQDEVAPMTAYKLPL